MNFIDAARIVLTKDEGTGVIGRPGKPYRDSAGYWTIGIGHFIGLTLTEIELSQRVMDEMLMEDIERHLKDARMVIGEEVFDMLPVARQVAILSLVFTLGRNKFLQFNKTIRAIKEGAWEDAATQVLKSKWAQDVDPKQRVNEGRDDRIAYMLRNGELHPAYGQKVVV